MSDATDKAGRVIAHANAVFTRLDERDGAAREAGRRERARLNRAVGRKLAKAGIAVGIIALLTIIVGLFVPIGMFGFLAAVGIAIGLAALLGFMPAEGSAPAAPSADLANGPMVQRFDSYLYRRRAALPEPARAEVDAIAGLLPGLRRTLERLETIDPEAQDARRLMALHLPGLIDRYSNVPPEYRGQRDGEGLSVDERLVEGLAAGRAALAEVGERLARKHVAALETQGRFIRDRYPQERIEG